MTMKSPKKRKYDSSRRKAQAEETQKHILLAAQDLFKKQGYTGTTVESIAKQAGVATETVYARFGNKRAVLSRLVDIAILGNDEQVPLLLSSAVREVELEKVQLRQIQMFSRQIANIMSRVAPLFEIMRSAAKTESEIAEILGNYLKGRFQGMSHFVNALNANGVLREGMSKKSAAETVWALTSAEIYNLYIVDLGWSHEKYEAWLTETLARLLLP